MDVTVEEFDRCLFFDHERKLAEAIYARNHHDADNLTRWAEALLELSRFRSNINSRKMIKDAISKLNEALSLNSENHYTLWCLGNVYSSLARLYPERDTSTMYFDMAYEYFKKALDKDPENKLYLRSKQKSEHISQWNSELGSEEMSDNNKAPKPHMETHKNGLGQQLMDGGSSGSSNPKAAKKPKSSDLMLDMFGLVILAVGIFAWRWISRVPPPPPR